MENNGKKITRKNPKGAGRPSLPKKERKINRKESLKAYTSSRKLFKCLVDPILYDRIKTFKDQFGGSWEEMLVYIFDKIEGKIDEKKAL